MHYKTITKDIKLNIGDTFEYNNNLIEVINFQCCSTCPILSCDCDLVGCYRTIPSIGFKYKKV